MKKRVRKTLALLTAFLLVVSALPAYAFAEEAEDIPTFVVEQIEAVSEEEPEVETDITDTDLEDEETGIIQPLSLLPIEEIWVDLDLSDLNPIELRAFPVETLLSRLTVYGTGQPVVIADDAAVLWSRVKDENGNQIRDSYRLVERDQRMDMSGFYSLEIIVGSPNQLDPDNTRYIVSVTPPDEEDIFEFELYSQSANGQRAVMPADLYYDENYYGDLWYYDFSLPEAYLEMTDFYMGFSLIPAYASKYDVVVYRGRFQSLEAAQAAAVGSPQIDVTSQAYGVDMSALDAGLKCDYDGWYDEIFTVVFMENGEAIAVQLVSVEVYVNSSHVSPSGSLYAEVDGWKRIVSSYPVFKDVESDVAVLEYTLDEGYSISDEYYICFYYYDGETGDADNGKVNKAVVGHFNSLAAAANETDIKDQLFPDHFNAPGAGFKGNFSGKGIDFTIFVEGDVWKYTVKALAYDQPVQPEYDDAPTVGSADTYFYASGVRRENGAQLDSYVMPYEHDTYYGYGYQTLLVDHTGVDMEKLKLEFGPSTSSAEIYAGEKQESGVTVQDFSNGAVQYTAKAENGEDIKNYWVTVVEKEAGPKLFVNGPEKREIFLDNYFDYHHDVFIANVGDAELTGLSVELNAANVKLDEYWFVGGPGNDTLDAFDGVWSTASRGELSNVAKIRLLPDGDGEINGTLTISADNQEPVVITLLGRAGNPRIITESLSNAVKYVPYSYLVATNNMHDWNKVTFSLLGGRLPSGVTLLPNGEIYGVPKESGTFNITVRADYSRREFSSSSASFTLTVLENTDANVNAATDEGYEVLVRIPATIDTYEDREFKLAGEYNEFIDFWLDGEKLVKDVDYTAEDGSTKITIQAQTFRGAGSGSHTISAEFRVNGDVSEDLKKSAQNYTYSTGSGGSSGGGGRGGSSGSAPAVTPPAREPDGDTAELSPAPQGTPTVGSFTDIAVGSWYYDDVKWAYEKGLMVGVSDAQFDPAGIVSQSQMAAVLARLAGADLSQYENTVPDGVDAGQWYSASVAWARDAGLLDGMTFDVYGTMPRENIAVILMRYLDFLNTEYTVTEEYVVFADQEAISPTASEALQVLYKLDIMKGKGEGIMDPLSATTRAELAALLHRVANLTESAAGEPAQLAEDDVNAEADTDAEAEPDAEGAEDQNAKIEIEE